MLFADEQFVQENVMVPVALAGSIVVGPEPLIDAVTKPVPAIRLIFKLPPLGEVTSVGGFWLPSVIRLEFGVKEMDGEDTVSPLLLLTLELKPLLPTLISAPLVMPVVIDTAPPVAPSLEVLKLMMLAPAAAAVKVIVCDPVAVI